jgi:glycosyltransferase involved in cell wall biosynthesis
MMTGAAAGERLHGVLITYRRPADLAAMLAALAGQTHRLATLIVVDNDPGPETRALVEAATDAAGEVRYVAAAENLGPAGGLALGMDRALRTAADGDWLVALDDDNPPQWTGAFRDLADFGRRMRARQPRVGCVGIVGGMYDLDTGMGGRLPDARLSGPIEVAYISGGGLPFFAAEAVRAVGVPDPRLFFGFEELEYGLRLDAAGWPVIASGDLWLRSRGCAGRLGLTGGPSRSLEPLSWRRYYSLRNMMWILREHGRPVVAARLGLRATVLKPLYNLPRQPRLALAHAAVGARAMRDSFTGRLGRTIDPDRTPYDAAMRR